ncbi:hypothetical protein JCM10450v2_003989 [Rhodotorula kratochvilovae]
MPPRRTQPPPSASGDLKSSTASFSFVEDPTTRFVAELPSRPPSRPSTPPALPLPAGDALLAFAPPSSGAMAAPPATPALRLQPNGAPVKLAAGTGAPNSLASAPLLDGDDRTPMTAQGPEQQQRSSSRSRRRLTASLGSLLSGPKRDKRRTTDDDPSALSASTGSGGGAAPLVPQSSRRSSSASRRPLFGGSAVVDSPALDPSSTASPSPLRTSKPPVTLPHLFRRRPSASNGSIPPTPASPPAPTASPPPATRASFEIGAASEPRRPSLDELMHTQRASNSSDGSLGALTASGSAVSTAPTSPDARAVSEEEGATPAEKRRRGSLALASQLSQDGRDDDVEDISDFVMASGSYSTSPLSTSTPFARRPSNAASSTGGFSPLLGSDAASPRLVTTSGNSSPPLHPRRLTRNIEGLSLSDLRRTPSTSAAPPPSLPSQTAAPFAVTSASPPQSSPPSASVSRASSSRGHLGALPRLLSTNAIATIGGGGAEQEQEQEQETEQETEESETDTEAESPDEDEGETYATSDEGPITTRSPLTTPAQTPAVGAGAGSVHPTPRARTPGATIPRPATSRLPSLAGLSISTAVGGPSSWVGFAHTPTPGTARTARAPGGLSYFDLPRPTSSGSAGAGGSNAPPKTPLALMSMSDVARGKRPALQEDVDAAAAGPGPATAEASDRSMTGAAAPSPTLDAGARAGLYRLRSQSVIALASPSMVDEEGAQLGTAGIAGLDPVWQQGVPAGQKTPGFLSFGLAAQKQQEDKGREVLQDAAPQTPAPLDLSVTTSPASTQPSSPVTTRSRPTTASPGNRLQRTRSMYELRDAPPAYSSMYRQSGTGATQVILPREEEGKEGLPGYSCAIHIEGYMPRKLEFTAPGVQARDRAWKRQYFVLHGTSIKIYRFDLRSHPIPGEDDWSVVAAADIAGSDGPPPLHFHEGEYGADQPPAGHRFSIEHAKAKAKDRIIASATASAENALVRHYSLQNAESGLAADYIKRKHVVRVRAEGEQFLLQAKDDRGVIDLIEALQAATNVSLDLDARPLPKFITLPRRRRRRRARPVDPAAAANGAAATTNGTAAAATNGTAPAASGRGEDRMGDMLAEEQNSYSQRTSGTVM